MPGEVTAPRPWFWALSRDGHGPDWHFTATFRDAPGLARAVSRGLSPAFVRVSGGVLHMAHVLATDRYDETPLLMALLRRPELGLGDWTVAYGGDFAGVVAAGTGGDSLRDYLGLAPV